MPNPLETVFYCCPNLASTDVEPAVPWDFDPAPFKTRDKAKYQKWRIQDTTEHLFYTGVRALAPTIRPSDTNPIAQIGAIIADYDAEITDDDVKSMLEKDIRQPNFIHTTFSHGRRLIWTLEKPLLLPHNVTTKFFAAVLKNLKLKSLLPGLDLDAFKNWRLMYDVGFDWIGVEESKNAVTWAEACGWLVTASEGAPWRGDKIDLTIIAEEVERRFPGRWPGPFELDMRGPRFWDPAADNPTGAIIRETGMQCFTGHDPFKSWASIFGTQFMDRHQQEDLGRMIEDVWFDGKKYWYPAGDGLWVPHDERGLTRHLKVVHGLSGERDEGRTHSQVERALHAVDEMRRVAGAAPFIFRPAGMIEFMGEKVINTANCQVLQPPNDLTGLEWGDGFPWIAQFLEEFFDPDEQIHWFLAWLQRFYLGALNGEQTQGQAMFIIGPTGRGKTFLSNVIVSNLMGGHQDASDFLLGKDRFNKPLFHKPLWTIDDALPGDTNDQHRQFSSLLKKITANSTFQYHAKFADAVMVEWMGRVMVSGNLDAESLRILPDCDTSILDKIMFLKVGKPKRHFESRSVMTEQIMRELPHFAAYLVEHEPDESLFNADPRYGIHSYHHPDLRDSAGDLTDTATMRQVLSLFMREFLKDTKLKSWKGTGIELIQVMSSDDSIRSLIARHTPRWFATQLGKLQAQGCSVTSTRERGLIRWEILPDSFL